MGADVGLAHRAEGAVAHVQRHLGPVKAFGRQLRAHLRGEVQPGGGRGHAPGLVRSSVGGLVALAVGLVVLSLQVRRQRHVADVIQYLRQLPPPLQAQTAAAIVPASQQHHTQVRVELRRLAHLHALGRAHQAFGFGAKPTFLPVCPVRPVRPAFTLPHLKQGQRSQEQHLHPAPGVPSAKDPRREHAGVVGHQQAALGEFFCQNLRQVGKVHVLGLGLPLCPTLGLGVAVQHQKARGRALGAGPTGDALRRQLVHIA